MSVSKRLRFEVFKRDGFACKYCGRKPPEVVLEPDHIIPKSKDGPDVITNLVAACFDCNRGKSNIPLTSLPQSLEADAKVRRERLRQIKWLRALNQRERAVQDEQIEYISDTWIAAIGDDPQKYQVTEGAWETIRKFLKLLPAQQVNDAAALLWKVQNKTPDSQFRFFCGCCWRMIRQIKEEKAVSA